MECEICRVCLNSIVTLVDIFIQRQQTDPDNPEPSLADMLNEIALCHVKPDDNLPQKICLSCVIGAQNAWKFKRNCERSYRRLTGLEPVLQLKQEVEQLQLEEQQLKPEEPQLKPEAQQLKQEPQQLKPEAQQTKLEVIPGLQTKADIFCDSIKLESPEQDTNEKPYKCNMCSKTFAHKKILRVHKTWHAQNKLTALEAVPKDQLIENRIKPPKPKLIENRIKQPKDKLNENRNKKPKLKMASKKKLQSQIKHVLSQEADRQYQCSICNKSYRSSAGLKRHRYTHTGECPYPCPYCREAFHRSDYCRSHIKKIHEDQEMPAKLLMSKKSKKK